MLWLNHVIKSQYCFTKYQVQKMKTLHCSHKSVRKPCSTTDDLKLKSGKTKKVTTTRYLRWVRNLQGMTSTRTWERKILLGTNVCVCLCEKVWLSHKCTSSFPGSDFSQDKATRLLPPSHSHTHYLSGFRQVHAAMCACMYAYTQGSEKR